MLDERISDLQGQVDTRSATYKECDSKLKELEAKFKDIESQMKVKIDAADNIKVCLYVYVQFLSVNHV